MKYAVSAAALAAALGFAGVAHAGSLADEPVVYHSPIVWSGFYVGAHVGGAWGDSDFSRAKDGGPKLEVESDPDGVFGGLQIGYDKQHQKFVFGLVGDLAVASIDGEDSQDGPPTAFKTEYDWLATIRARAGVLAKDNFLVYAHGGVAFADISFESVTNEGPRKNVRNEETQTGWALGGGAEWAIAPGMSLFAEYTYMDFGDQTAESEDAPKAVTQESDLQTVKVGVNFKIGREDHMDTLK